jgi:hypothetical protein
MPVRQIRAKSMSEIAETYRFSGRVQVPVACDRRSLSKAQG